MRLERGEGEPDEECVPPDPEATEGAAVPFSRFCFRSVNTLSIPERRCYDTPRGCRTGMASACPGVRSWITSRSEDQHFGVGQLRRHLSQRRVTRLTRPVPGKVALSGAGILSRNQRIQTQPHRLTIGVGDLVGAHTETECHCDEGAERRNRQCGRGRVTVGECTHRRSETDEAEQAHDVSHERKWNRTDGPVKTLHVNNLLATLRGS
ncbi:hypothetical protein RHCRD62_40028 [Rhodococcus sp. RD6.2]|nr:hypothetical protein RHCRD62_40028 [Rhodococcus sp. RD6.2]